VLGFSTGVLDEAWMSRIGRAYGEGLRPVARVESETFHARFEPVLASGLDQRKAMEPAASLAGLVDRSAREHAGVPVKWLGDGVMVHFGEPAGAVRPALGMVREFPRLASRRRILGWRPGR
jgi:hypothetical protein